MAEQKPSASQNAASGSAFAIPTAEELAQRIALAESERARQALRREEAAEAEKKALIDQMSKPSGLSDEEIMQRAHEIIERAVKNGRTSVQVFRFSNQLCTDRGRAINQGEQGWEKTLTGVPKELYVFWEKYLQPLGYKIRYEIVDFPNGIPGDVGITLRWG